jgi:hypothetical protein
MFLDDAFFSNIASTSVHYIKTAGMAAMNNNNNDRDRIKLPVTVRKDAVS